jgi:RNA polymerase sigma-70 factor (sigma-E family)
VEPVERGREREPDPELAELCRSQHRRLVGLLALYVGDRAIAEDLAQETLVLLHIKWAEVRRMDSPSGWLAGVAINLARSWWRRRSIEQRANRRHQAGRPAAADLPESADVLVVRAAVASLPPRQRSALVLRYYARLSIEQTAEALGCQSGTVKSLTHKAIASLRRNLALDDLDDLRAPPDTDDAGTEDTAENEDAEEANRA